MFLKSARRAGAALASAALLGLGLGLTMTSGVASAAPAPNASTIDPATPAALTVHKFAGPSVNCPNDGTDQTTCVKDAKGSPLQAGFSAYTVLYDGQAVDLTTNAGWAQASYFMTNWHGSPSTGVLLTDASGKQYTVGTTPVASGTTAGDGSGVTFANLAKSLYIVIESTPPVAPVGSSYTPVVPFAVTLPMATRDGSSWIYNVNAYPKNNLDTIAKSVSDLGTAGSVSGTTLSNVLTYTVKTSISPGFVQSTATTGTVLTRYIVSDTFDPRLTVPAGVVSSVYVQGDAVNAPQTPLAVGTDYTVAISGQAVTVTFTQTGLDKLVFAQSQDSTAKVYTVFKPTLTDANCYATPTAGQVACTGLVDGNIKNTASF